MFRLWFGDERGYNATILILTAPLICCGLVMKEDITQLKAVTRPKFISCGLVMKEDITQRRIETADKAVSCGLVMKEDITQHLYE